MAFAPFERVGDVLFDLLDGRQPHAVAAAAIETLSRFDEDEVAEILIDAWSGLTPRLRAMATDALFARRQWLTALLDSVEAEAVTASQLDPTRIQSLLAHPDREIRKRASGMFEGRKPAGRQSVIDAHPSVRESLVYGRPHSLYGQLPVAKVVLSPGKDPEDVAASLRRHCYARLAPYKVPKEFEVIAGLPRTDSLKLVRDGRA